MLLYLHTLTIDLKVSQVNGSISFGYASFTDSP